MLLLAYCAHTCAYLLTLRAQLYDDIVAWSASIGVQLATHPVPPAALTLAPKP